MKTRAVLADENWSLTCMLVFVLAWIFRLSLHRPYTFIVMAILIAILGGISIATKATDVFPYINIPVVEVVWSYRGISADDMSKRVITLSELSLTTTVNDIRLGKANATTKR